MTPSFSPTAWNIFGCSSFLRPVHVLDEALDAARVREVLALAVALVDQLDLGAVVEERQFADALGEDVEVIFDVVEGLGGRHEMDFGAAPVARTHDGQRRHGDAAPEFHLVELSVAPDLELQPVRQRVDDRHADAVQPAGNLVAVVVELAAGMQFGHHDLGRRALFLVAFLDVRGNAAAVVGDADRIVAVDDDLDVVAPAGECLVDRVVEHLEDHVMQAGAVRRVADVHAGALAHGVQALEDLDAGGIVVAAVGLAVGLRLRRRMRLS